MDTRQLLRSALPLIGIGVIVAGAMSGLSAAAAIGIGGLCGLVHLISLGRNVTAFIGTPGEGSPGARGPVQLALSYMVRLGISAAVIVGLIQILDPIPLVIGFGLVLLAATVYVGRGGLLVPNPTEGA